MVGFEPLDVPEGHLCCGSAGTYNILQPEIAAALRDRKLANIAAADPDLVIDEDVTIAVQVNGRLRATLSLPRDIANDDAERAALADHHVQRAMAGKPARRVIVVPNRIINVVV